MNWGQFNPDLNDFHSDPIEICSTFWIPDITDWWCQQEETHLVLATGPGNPPVVRVWTGKTVRFGARTIQKPDPQLRGGPNPDLYPSTRGFCRVWLDPSVRISGSSFRVFLFMVAFRYLTVLCKILPLVHHCLCSIDWLPLWSKQAETCRLLHHEVERERFFVLHH